MRAHSRSRWSLVACGVPLLLACGGSDPATGGGGAGTAGQGGTVSGSGSGGCPDEPDAPASAVCVTEVTGSVTDEQDAPLAALLVSVCGSVSCNPGNTDTSGAFSVSVNRFITLSEFSVLPHARELDFASFYYRLPEDSPGPIVDVGNVTLLAMPADGPTLVVKTDLAGAPAQSVTSNGVTLDVAEGVAVQLAFEDVSLGEAGKQFRVLEVPEGGRDGFVDPSLAVAQLYALYPFETTFRPEGLPAELAAARLSFPNPAALPADGTVEILALGSYTFPDWITPAAFEVVATGSVASDGSRIEMDAGEGVPHLTWLAIRAAP